MEDLCNEALAIFLKTADSLEPGAVIKERMAVKGGVLYADNRPFKLSDFTEIKLIGFGKASLSMGAAIEELLEGRITKGLLVTNRRAKSQVDSKVIVAGHPIPDAASLTAGARILEELQSCGDRSLIIFLISGGGSALVESPLFDEVTLEDLKKLNSILVTGGASIQEINVIRKHFSGIKGGRLGYLSRRSERIALYISDVNKGDIRSIASNPLIPDDSTLDEFSRIVAKLDLLRFLPPSLSSLIREDRIPALPHWVEDKNIDQLHLMLMENSDAVSVAADIAREFGFEVAIEDGQVEGDYKSIADQLIARFDRLHDGRKKKVCLISGGEASCPVSGSGIGGRNQQFVLYAASKMAAAGIESSAILSCGTDGLDGNSVATGAVLSVSAINMAKERKLNFKPYYDASDSHAFFLEFGGLITTGPVGNNLRDLRIFLSR